MNTKPRELLGKNLAPGMVVFASVAVLYFAAYCWAVKGGYDDKYVGPVSDQVVFQDGITGFRTRDEYRVGGEPAKVFFWPANQLDRLIRRDHWLDSYKWEPCDCVSKPPGD